jgi:hypothetical protein
MTLAFEKSVLKMSPSMKVAVPFRFSLAALARDNATMSGLNSTPKA